MIAINLIMIIIYNNTKVSEALVERSKVEAEKAQELLHRVEETIEIIDTSTLSLDEKLNINNKNLQIITDTSNYITNIIKETAIGSSLQDNSIKRVNGIIDEAKCKFSEAYEGTKESNKVSKNSRDIILKVMSIMTAMMLIIINLGSLKVSADIKEYVIDELFISEDNYSEKIQNQVIPYLNSIMQEGNIHGEDDIELYYRKYKVENSTGSIVISHGFGEFIEIYNELIYYFTKNGYNVFIMEHRGHGLSGMLGIEDETQIHVEDFKDYVEDFRKFVDEVVVKETGDDDLFLFAHSMGGAIGSTFLIDYPDYFDDAILSSPMMTVNTRSIPLFIADIIAGAADSVGLGGKYVPGKTAYKTSIIEESGTSSVNRFNYTRDVAIDNEVLRRGGPSLSWLNNSIDIGKYITNKKNAYKVEIPVILFQPENDDFVKEKGQNLFSKYAKDCTLIKVENSKHEIYKEQDHIAKDIIESVISFYNSKNVK